MPIGEDAIGGYTFKIEIGGVVLAQFKEVGGIESSREVIEHRELNLLGKEVIKKLPGKRSWGDITLKRGVTDNNAVWEWHQKVMDGKIDEARSEASIVIFDYQGGETGRWDISNCWPCKVTISGLQAGSSDVLVEEMTLTHEGLKKVS